MIDYKKLCIEFFSEYKDKYKNKKEFNLLNRVDVIEDKLVDTTEFLGWDCILNMGVDFEFKSLGKKLVIVLDY